ncbi:hypothetical protein K470DRAFT_242258 [Piedraia hortae CBS 480.64]|uniref:Uncharacterized protein n=1 Tax=Piedraia hortae CBS 480.64 TaxID=1314780 RepID=A0A6A7C7I4_9PEZI|nr:hypothetical protein K470DRAFT_242258 [Piedraia hortae CBS 480.64]
MARVESWGVHFPVALHDLIRESLLPEDADTSHYSWQTYVFNDGQEDVEEELLVTKNCVAWSRGAFLRNIYQFHLEGEDVAQAIITWFSTEPSAQYNRSNVSAGTAKPDKVSRALVVLLRTKLHIYFLPGTHHIVDLPFEVARIFPAFRGCILQRKQLWTQTTQASAPSSYPSFLQSPSVTKSLRASHPTRPSGVASGLDSLFAEAFEKVGLEAEADYAPLYSFANPLSDFGVLSFCRRHQKPRQLGQRRTGTQVDFETLDVGEELVYASAADELAESQFGASLMLLVTVNNDNQTVSLWHAWYVGEQSLHDLMEQHGDLRAAKTKCRSSFLNTSLNSGTATPTMPKRDPGRVSLPAPATLRVRKEPHGIRSASKKTRQDEEASMASQMDPDYQLPVSQRPRRESRRISSLNSDFRTSLNANASFVGVGRRNASFGERQSLGPRISRASTPGSVFSRSIGPYDDFPDMDIDGDAIENVIRHMRLTHETDSVDNVFGSAVSRFRRELMVRKLQSRPISFDPASRAGAKDFEVATLAENHPLMDSDDQKLNVYIHEKISGLVQCIQLTVTLRALWPEFTKSPHVAIPMVNGETCLGHCPSMVKLRDGSMRGILFAGQGLTLSTKDSIPCPLPASPPYRAYSPYQSPLLGVDQNFDQDTVLPAPEGPVVLKCPGIAGCYDEVDATSTHHRRRVKFQPLDNYVSKLMRVTQAVLPSGDSDRAYHLWCKAAAWLAQKPDIMAATSSSIEFVAWIATMMSFAVPLLDSKTKAAVSKLAGSRREGKTQSKKQVGNCNLSPAIWSWMPPPQSWGQHSAVSMTPTTRSQQDLFKDQLLVIAAGVAEQLSPSNSNREHAASCAVRLMLGLHIFREEQKLCTLSTIDPKQATVASVIAQLGTLLGLREWGLSRGMYYGFEAVSEGQMAYLKPSSSQNAQLPIMRQPVSVFQWFEFVLKQQTTERYPLLAVIAGMDHATVSTTFTAVTNQLTPRLCALSRVIAETAGLSVGPASTVELMAQAGIDSCVLETLPEAIGAPLKEAAVRCERDPPTTWSPDLLQLVGRNDLVRDIARNTGLHAPTAVPPRDIQAICHSLEHNPPMVKTRAWSRHAVSQLIFNEDRRLVEAVNLVHYGSTQIGQCPKKPEWDDAEHLHRQRRAIQWIALRMMALPAGHGMIHYDSIRPLLTERYMTQGFTASVLMQPMGTSLTIDRAGISEDKFSWAYFHAGAAAGLRISRKAKGIDTSWIAFNKPSELTNRHAGLLLALGLGGHLRSLAKWISFKYLTPIHTMTSIGLLLGLSASHLGTMDSLVTRMLSVHIHRMLPVGAAELNVSPMTQTAGLVGIGLLYHNTQHRRMTEVMLSEIEYMELEDPDSGPDQLRDESYRLAAGFALGLINLSQGRELKGLHGIHLPERLLGMAIGPRPVNAVHVFDRATAGAIIAVALVWMKSGDTAVAKKVDIPDSETQFEHVRPDMLMLRAMARHIIMWDDIDAQGSNWIEAQLPSIYKGRLEQIQKSLGKHPLSTSDVPFYNIITGLAWALGLKYAGTGCIEARDQILAVVDAFYHVSGDAIFYNAKITRSTVRRCIDMLLLSAATVMAGTGDLQTFRYLRRLHGRTNAETSYGSHLAAHMAIGALFLAGGTQTFGTSNLAIAALMLAFYPNFPNEVLDNSVHLQAFRHFWVLAAETRCLVIQDVDTHRPIQMPVHVRMRDGRLPRTLTAPCLLPELDQIESVETADPAYWKVTLDFAGNPAHLVAFKSNQTVFVRKCPAGEAHDTTYGATLAMALNDAQASQSNTEGWQSMLKLPAFQEIDKSDVEVVLPPDPHNAVHASERGTVVDDRMALQRAVMSDERDELWNLRVLFAWAERAREEDGGKLRWLGLDVIEALRARMEGRQRGG